MEGYKEAHSLYHDMTGGLWLWQAPEYFITSTVAKSIFAIQGPKYLTLENNVRSAIEDAGAKGCGRLSADFRQNGRADITLWWADGTPRAIVEIKNQMFSNFQLEKDIRRIKAFLLRRREATTYQFGAFGFYGSATGDNQEHISEKLESKTSDVLERTRELIGDALVAELFTTSVTRELEHDAWHAACILIKPRNT